MLRTLGRRLYRALVARPSAPDIAELVVAIAVVGAAALLISVWTDLLAWAPRSGGEIVGLSVLAFFVPALAEEVLFRGLLIPDKGETRSAYVWIAVSTLLFVLWHALETVWLPGARAIFLRPDFLSLAALLGLACAILRRRSGSIWTAVLLHWLAAVGWIGFLGGPSVTELR